MRAACWLYLCALGLASSSELAQAANSTPVLRLDAAVDALVARDAQLETLLQRESTFEGPTWVPDGNSGYLLFADVPGDVIDRLNADGTVVPYLQHIYAGKDISEAYESFGFNGQKKFRMLGANGVTRDRHGRIVYCAYSDGQIVRLEADGRRTVLASHFGDRRLNAPNDLVYSSDGSLYFTDSRAGTRRADGEGVPHKGLYVLRAGVVQLLTRDIDHPNGLAFSPDEKYLYVTNSFQSNVLRFELQSNGIANQQVFVDMSGAQGSGRPDGVKTDSEGNVYATGPGGVWIISRSGRHLGTLQAPGPVNNFTFGGKDLKTLYLTGYGSVYRIPLKVAGRKSP